MADAGFEQRVAAVRRFTRFYTQKIGVLHEGLLQSPYSLTESRVLYELANREQPTATELCKDLGLDAGYLSRILRRFEKAGLIRKQASMSDGRQSLTKLSRRWLPRSSRNSCSNMTRNASVAGLPRKMARTSDRCSWSRTRPRSRSCGC